ncbi:MAG: hypothetical protein JRI43_06685, partial [Deltaproteobacteria bacterium]|nr:hypothetical protein [Deltaproteobacteria bacterium]
MGFSPGPLYKNIFNSLLEARLSDQVGSREEEIKFVNERFKEHLKK